MQRLRIILDKNTYFFLGVREGKYGLRAGPHRNTKMKLYFLVILVNMTAKIVIKDVGWL